MSKGNNSKGHPKRIKNAKRAAKRAASIVHGKERKDARRKEQDERAKRNAQLIKEGKYTPDQLRKLKA